MANALARVSQDTGPESYHDIAASASMTQQSFRYPSWNVALDEDRKLEIRLGHGYHQYSNIRGLKKEKEKGRVGKETIPGHAPPKIPKLPCMLYLG